MQTIKGNLQLDRGVKVPLFSYRNAFFDGYESLHPAFYAGKLFVLSRVCMEEEILRIKPQSVDSKHLKNAESFVMVAPNQKAAVFQHNSAGTLSLNAKEVSALVDAGADLSYFSYQNTHKMFKKVEGGYIPECSFEDLSAAAIKAGIVKTDEELHGLLGLPASVVMEDGSASEAYQDCFNEVKNWAETYVEDPSVEGFEQIKPFITGGNYAEVPVPGMLPATADLREKLVVYAAQEVVRTFSASAFGEGVSENDAIETAQGFIEQDNTNVLLVAALSGDAASVEVLASGLGIELPEVTTEDLAAVGTEEAPVAEPAVEGTPVEEEPVEEEQPVQEEEVLAHAHEPAIEVPATADLPAMQQTPTLPTVSPVVRKLVTNQVKITGALAAMTQALHENSQLLAQEFGEEEAQVEIGETAAEQ